MRRAASLLSAGCLATGVTACGAAGAPGSGTSGPAASSNPSTLLSQTFAATHSVKSGILDLSLTITPQGSSALTKPVSLSLHGPFESRSGGRASESALTVSFSGIGRRGSLGLTTTASGAYLTLAGTSYRLPSAEFRKLQRSLGGTSSAGSAPGLASLGIDPQSWVSHPRIVGTATVDGVPTEHLHAGVDVRAFVLGLGKVLARESSTLRSASGGAASSVPTHITSAQASKLAASMRRPTVDIYSGKRDSTLRRLTIDTTLPVHGSLASRLGGMSSAALALSIDYSHLGEPQTISAPAHAESYRALQSRLRALSTGIGASALGATALGSTATVGAASPQLSKYTTCIEKASGQVAKMQKCASLLQRTG